MTFARQYFSNASLRIAKCRALPTLFNILTPFWLAHISWYPFGFRHLSWQKRSRVYTDPEILRQLHSISWWKTMVSALKMSTLTDMSISLDTTGLSQKRFSSDI